MVILVYRGKQTLLPPGLTVAQAMAAIGLSLETHFAVHNGEIASGEEILEEGDVVTCVAIIMGGNR
jgi:sulfur carrier protein ThiS